MTPEALALADEYWSLRHSTDHLRALWKGDLAYLEEWEDLGTEAEAARARRLLDHARRAEALLDGSSPDHRATLETIAFTARAWVDELEWRDEIGLINHATGLHAELLTFLPRYRLVTAEHGERYLEKLHRLPGMLSQLADRLRQGVERGTIPIRLAVRRTAEDIDRQLGAPVSQDPLIAQAAPIELGGSEATTWRRRLEVAVEGVVRPALGRLRDVLTEEVLAAARPDDRPGIGHLPGGQEGYARLVHAHTSTDLTAERVHEVGLEQVARLEEEYLRVAGPVLGTDRLDDIYRRLREDEELRYREGEAIVADSEAALAKAAGVIGEWFGRVPRSPCVAEEVQQGPLAFYSKPDPETGRPGRFFFNTSDPSAWGRFQLEAVTYHEGVPGHHLQIALAIEDPDLHPIHREIYIAAYSEGWGLYTERLADEMGLYSTELDRVGMLAADSMRACRLVVDTGMHALGWSRDGAIAYMLDHSPLSRRQAEGEIDRYLGSPGQALGYMIGRLEIDRIRSRCEQALGASFELRGFHDTVLGTGSVPLGTLERVVEEWVTRGSRADAARDTGARPGS